jgi:hypothetical protein
MPANCATPCRPAALRHAGQPAALRHAGQLRYAMPKHKKGHPIYRMSFALLFWVFLFDERHQNKTAHDCHAENEDNHGG